MKLNNISWLQKSIAKNGAYKDHQALTLLQWWQTQAPKIESIKPISHHPEQITNPNKQTARQAKNRHDRANSVKTTRRKHTGQKKVGEKETLENLTRLALCRPSPGKDYHQAYPQGGRVSRHVAASSPVLHLTLGSPQPSQRKVCWTLTTCRNTSIHWY